MFLNRKFSDSTSKLCLVTYRAHYNNVDRETTMHLQLPFFASVSPSELCLPSFQAGDKSH